MFNCIQIKQDSTTGSPVFDIAALIDSMLYYREVIIIASHLEMNLLIDEFGENNLLELLKTGRLTLKLNCQHFGVGYHPGTSDVVSVGNFSLNYHNAEDLLFYNRNKRIDDRKACELSVKKFSPYVSLYEFPLTINDLYYKDFEDVGFMSQIAKDYLSIYYPEYHQDNEIELVLSTVSDMTGFYRIETNIDVEQLNKIHTKNGISFPFMFSNLLFAVGNTNMDVYSTSDFGCELDPDPRFGYAFKTRIDSCIDRAKRSNDQLSSFQKTFALDYYSVGEAYKNGFISMTDVIKLINGHNSINFRNWLNTLDDTSFLSGEFVNECEERLKDGRLIRVERSAINVLLAGAALIKAAINPVLAAGWTAVDTFLLDKFSQGWTPKFFQDKILRNKRLKKE